MNLAEMSTLLHMHFFCVVVSHCEPYCDILYTGELLIQLTINPRLNLSDCEGHSQFVE